MDNPQFLQKKSIASPFYLLWSFKKIYKWGGGSDIQKKSSTLSANFQHHGAKTSEANGMV